MWAGDLGLASDTAHHPRLQARPTLHLARPAPLTRLSPPYHSDLGSDATSSASLLRPRRHGWYWPGFLLGLVPVRLSTSVCPAVPPTPGARPARSLCSRPGPRAQDAAGTGLDVPTMERVPGDAQCPPPGALLVPTGPPALPSGLGSPSSRFGHRVSLSAFLCPGWAASGERDGGRRWWETGSRDCLPLLCSPPSCWSSPGLARPPRPPWPPPWSPRPFLSPAWLRGGSGGQRAPGRQSGWLKGWLSPETSRGRGWAQGPPG